MRTALLAAALAVAAICAPVAAAASWHGSASDLARTDAASRARSCAHADRPIVFAHRPRSGGHSAIIAVDLRARCPRNLTGYAAYNTHPDWSPDGRKITFIRSGLGIFVMRADGTGVHPITRGNDPAWSPNGKWIAFSRDDEEGLVIHLIHPDGTGERAITPAYGFIDGGPAWAPDSKQIAYTAEKMWPSEAGPPPELDYPGSPFEPRLYRIRIDGTGERMILPRNLIASIFAPAWSAQNRIAFGTYTARPVPLYAYSVTPQGTDKRKLVGADDRGWTWSPSGRYFMYARPDPSSRAAFYRLAIVDTRTEKVRTLPTYGDDPSWRRTP